MKWNYILHGKKINLILLKIWHWCWLHIITFFHGSLVFSFINCFWPFNLFLISNLMYRVFQLDMTYFEVQDGQLKMTSKFKKRKQHIWEIGTFEFYQYFFIKVTLAGLNSLWQKGCQNSTRHFMILLTISFFLNIKIKWYLLLYQGRSSYFCMSK